MTQHQALRVVGAFLRESFGRVVTTRACRCVRRVAGPTWVVDVVVAAKDGDVAVATLEVDDQGQITPRIGVDDVVSALRRGRGAPADAASDPLGDPGGAGHELQESFISGISDAVDGDEPPDDPGEIRRRVQEQLVAGDPASLRAARDLMPRLLADAERRGVTLVWMAEIERRLDDRAQAVTFLEAAAREFADRFDLTALEKCADLARAVATPDALARSPIRRQLLACRASLRPIDSMWEASALAPVLPEERGWLAERALLLKLASGEHLVREGEPSRNVFVIKSGLVAVLIDPGDGKLRRVRYCYPGWLLGESSVLTEGATATATLRAHGPTEVYAISAAALGLVMDRSPELRRRIAATKFLHRFDSFFTTHELLGQLDVEVRDEVIECWQDIAPFAVDTVVAVEGQATGTALLVIKGEVALYDAPGWDPDAPDAGLAGVLGADAFFGVRDALHEAPLPRTAVARAGTTVAFLDAARLRALVARAPEHVTALLERLG